MPLRELDNTDISILNLLQNDALLTHKEIAHQTNKSLSATQSRIRKLQESGIIKKSVTLLDREKIGMDMVIFVMLKTNNYGIGSTKDLRDSVGAFEEVTECYQVSGENDFILKVVVGNITQFNEFINEKLSSVDHISSVKSMFVITEGKYETAFRLKKKEL